MGRIIATGIYFRAKSGQSRHIVFRFFSDGSVFARADDESEFTPWHIQPVKLRFINKLHPQEFDSTFKEWA